MGTTVIKGTSIEILNLTTSSTDDIQVGFIHAVNTVLIKARTAVDLQVRSSRGNSFYYTIPSGGTLELDVEGNIKDGAVQAMNIWIRSTSATPVAEVIGLYGG